MSLSSGYYVIKHQRSNKVVSRHIVEDRSLLPKRVLVLQDGIDADPWRIQSLGSGNYRFSNRGGTASAIDGKIYCNLLDSEGNDDWQVKSGPGSNVFQIMNSDGLNWSVLDTEDNSQVATSPSADFFVVTQLEE